MSRGLAEGFRLQFHMASATKYITGRFRQVRHPCEVPFPRAGTGQGLSSTGSNVEAAGSSASTAQADDLEPNLGLHWYLAAQLRGSRAPSLSGLRGPMRLLLHLLAGARPGPT